MRTLSLGLVALCLFSTHSQAHSQAWRNCDPGSIGPGGCDSIGPGGGQSIGPGGGQSIGPGGGQSIGPGGGQSIGPGGGQSIGPGGGKSLDRDTSRGLNTDTMRPYENPQFGIQPVPIPSPQHGSISKGMTVGQVTAVLGTPAVRERSGPREALHFCVTGTTVDQFLVVLFDDNFAVSSRKYQVTSEEVGTTGHCSNFVRRVLR